ncbi:MAG: NADH-quinone oxidoreductase subunit L [Thermodesulfobacteriota bacterium]|jgi:NADH-quinone oxidoreductase subunit L
MKTVLFLLVFLPFLGALSLAVIGRHLPRRVGEMIACLAVLGSFVMAIIAFVSAGQKSQTVTLLPWFGVGDFSAVMSVYYDPLAAVMALMVTFVSSLIHLYSVSFMREDEDYVRFFCYMNLFVFAMLVVALSDNLLFLYLGWEGVGFCSYALIGFWYSDEVKATAGRKAFVLTRIGDVAFGIAIAFFFLIYNTLSLSSINEQAASLSAGMATALGMLLLWAAVGKSAQLPLAVWLPDAMAGPTPVSALIHAATMVTAGVYLLMRFFPLISLSSTTLLTIATVGAVTAFFAACSALSQKDIKRILAYSTISQVSYMFLGVGAGDLIGGMFHLLSHAFFKALLFLAAGCVIQALNEEHDIFRMGSLRSRFPVVFWLFLAGALALGAIPPFGGFFSKDRILLATFIHPDPAYKILWVLAAVTALLTPLYTFRLFFIGFLERPSATRESSQDKQGLRPVPKLMVWTLWPLAILSLIAGLLNLSSILSGNEWLARYLSPVPGTVPSLAASPALEGRMEMGTGLLSIVMLALSYYLYRPQKFLVTPTPGALPQNLEQLLFFGFYLDRFYQIAVVRPYQKIARFLWVRVDEGGLNEGFDRTGKLFPVFSIGLQLWTTGRLSTYLKMLLLGFTVILCALALGWYPW